MTLKLLDVGFKDLQRSHWHSVKLEDEFIVASNDVHNALVLGLTTEQDLDLTYIQVQILKAKYQHKMDIDSVIALSNDEYFNYVQNARDAEDEQDADTTSDIQVQLEKLLLHAVDQGASDLHITRGDTVAKVELRINGVLFVDSYMTAKKCDELVFVLYNVQATTKETTWNRSIAQNANILYTLGGRSYRFRYAHYPVFGETDGCYHCVLRIIPSGLSTTIVPDLNRIGLSEGEIEDVKRILSNPYGAYIIAGTTGSGKSTTLKNLMEWMQVNRYDDKGCFLTVEDPVEYQIYGAKQSSVLDVDGGGFHSAIKSALRRDPDVLMVGEIRDPVSSNALAGAVESGHYCFTTVHAGNIVTLLQRLTALGIPADKLSTPGFIAGLQCQKLVPVLCEHCKEPKQVTVCGSEMTVYTSSSEGCVKCNFRGVAGRQLTVEYILPTQDELEALANHAFLKVYQLWRNKRRATATMREGFSIREKAFAYSLQGRVCYDWFHLEFGALPEEDVEYILEKI
ncbi:ATPase, T2SS/T4P/T4SS family [Vibrio cholerae]|uniref:ATPase, T2SS/T4P/T4SS family n=1 Tax=Vibrio cholerae TaxID=666 RepID=UPI0022F3379D|nr:ATPase, T2SS/T4P/T4SS family [Vibrio cholerae]MDA5318410.1 Flp pilus assembly complex ATPase component TadA [Vibrio cholerae]